jgi:GH15 family glucan-1,4-alpha-glucosidase
MNMLEETPSQSAVPSRDEDGYLPLESYAALGDGRSVALVGGDGSIDWWCVPQMDAPPLFDRILAADTGGYLSITPRETFSVERFYLPDSNVLETVFITETGRARLTESLNSGSAGRLPWAELARRIEGVEGVVCFDIKIKFGTQADTVNPYISPTGNGTVFHAGEVLGMFLHGPGVEVLREDDLGVIASVRLQAGQRETLAIVAGRNEPLVIPSLALIDARIDGSDREWRRWSECLTYDGEFKALVTRSALALKLLISSPSGAIMAAATTSLPERVGGNKNYDYRFAWIRDAGYTINAFLAIGAQPEAKAAFTWLLHRLGEHGPHVCYTLEGELGTAVEKLNLPGYKHSQPVVGNDAVDQLQHGIYGDIFETARCFIDLGNILDAPSATILSNLADRCADDWQREDSGIWELPEQQHYTMSKISCWQALSRAVELAEGGHLPTTCRDRWDRARERILTWIDENCWSEQRQAYVFYPGSEKLDASLALAVRFGFPRPERLGLTLQAVERELRSGPFHFRYSEVDKEEGCFLACSFWIAEAQALLGRHRRGVETFIQAVRGLDKGVGIYSEMVDPQTYQYLGNLPQALTHLALIGAASTLSGRGPDR